MKRFLYPRSRYGGKSISVVLASAVVVTVFALVSRGDDKAKVPAPIALSAEESKAIKDAGNAVAVLHQRFEERGNQALMAVQPLTCESAIALLGAAQTA